MKFCLATALVCASASPVELGPYPGYTGDLKVSGSVGAYYSVKSDKVYMYYELEGVEAEKCKTAPEGVANACGIHIHAGNTCDDATQVGGHYYADSIDSDPWSPVTYSASVSGRASGKKEIVIGADQDISGRAMVVHDSTGGRVACALLPSGYEIHESVKFGPYPGYTGDLKVMGDASAYYNGNKDEVYISYRLSGVESDNCKTTPEGVANACGIHIHAGMTCDDASAVGGHYYDSDNIEADPWSPVTYTSKFGGFASGYAKVGIGADQDISGRAMVVHDSTGGRVACALLPTSLFVQSGKPVDFGPYPGYAGDLKVSGHTGAYYSTKSNKVYLYYSLRGVEGKECQSAPEGVANACGIHIHAGKTCNDADQVGGHYYADTVTADPWGAITYKTKGSGYSYGTAEVDIGAAQDISGRAMVVHDSTGARVACALLPANFFMV